MNRIPHSLCITSNIPGLILLLISQKSSYSRILKYNFSVLFICTINTKASIYMEDEALLTILTFSHYKFTELLASLLLAIDALHYLSTILFEYVAVLLLNRIDASKITKTQYFGTESWSA